MDKIKAHLALCNKALMVLQSIHAHLQRLELAAEEYIEFYEHSVEIYIKSPKTENAPWDVEVNLRTKYEETYEMKAHYINYDGYDMGVFRANRKDLAACLETINEIYDYRKRTDRSTD